jgi:hypothetical protein
MCRYRPFREMNAAVVAELNMDGRSTNPVVLVAWAHGLSWGLDSLDLGTLYTL